MESFAILLGLLVVFFVFAVPLLALARARRAIRLAKKNEDQWSQVLQRIYALEQDVKQLKGLVSRVLALELRFPQLEKAPLPKAAEAAAVLRGHEPVKAPVEPVAKAPPPAQVPPTEAPKIPVAAAGPLRVETLYQELSSQLAASGTTSKPTIPPASLTPVSASVPPPSFATLAKPTTSVGERMKSILNIEEALGTNWLNKLGIIILVIGVALFLAYQVRELGPAGKVLVGYLVSGALLGAGIFFERRERWRILARAGIGGGWALLFFVTYAMHHVAAAQVIDSQAVDLVLLLLVTIAMVAHTLRYDSQVVTGLAYLLAFSTVTISRSNAYSLAAGALLALGLVVIVVRKRWYELEVFGILASYINHYFWLRPIIEPMGGHHRPFPEFFASASLLVLYWAVFRASYLFRRSLQGREETTSSAAALLNSCLLLAVMKYQSVHPELAFWFLLALGAVELGLGQLPVARRRRVAFVILTTIGTTLLVAALPFRYSGATLPILWLAEAEAIFLAGVFTREIVFRRLGVLASLLVAGHMVFVDALRLGHEREVRAADFSDPRTALLFGVAALVFYFNAHWVPRRWKELVETRFEDFGFRALSYVGGILALLGVWAISTEPWLAVGWGALALAFALFAFWRKNQGLSLQAHVLALLAVIRALAVNLGTPGTFHHLSFRLITITMLAALLYLTSRWSGVADFARTLRIPAAYTWVASFLASLLMWYELEPASVALGWALFGLLLFELGIARRSVNLRLQAYLAFGSSFLRIFFVNLNAAGYPGELSPRVYTTAPLALAFYYVYWSLEGRGDDFLKHDRRLKAAQFHNYFGFLTLAALMRFELPPDWVVAAWATLVLGLLAVAWKRGQRVFLHQGYLLGFAVLFRAVLHNFYERSYFPAPFWQSRIVCVGVTVAMLFLALAFAFRLGQAPAPNSNGERNWLAHAGVAMDRHPEQIFFFIPFFLLSVLLALEMPSGMVTVAWGLEAVGVFLFALSVGQRSYRLSGLALLLVCVGKIVIRDVWGLQPRDRYLTFIVLGAALLGVSFLYTRYRETIRQYL